MIHLYDKDNDSLLGEISEEQFDFLMEHLEEESESDQDYYLTQDTVDFLEEEGADEGLLATLRKALGDRDEVEIRWESA